MSEFEDGFRAGLRQAIDIVHAEARWQWEQDQRGTVCAQVVAQRMGIVEDCLRGFQDRAGDGDAA